MIFFKSDVKPALNLIFSVAFLCLLICDIMLDKILMVRNVYVFRYIELVSYLIIDHFNYPFNYVTMCLIVITISTACEFVIEKSLYDDSSIVLRTVIVCLTIGVSAFAFYSTLDDSNWVLMAILKVLTCAIIVFIANYVSLVISDSKVDMNNMKLQLSSFETDNEKLTEYRERVQNINEEINHQKIDLTRANKELEQLNNETRSQADLMRYMSSTFDVMKYLNVTVDTISAVKNTKLCVMYICAGEYNNKYSTCVMKTNYSALQRRLKKDVDSIFDEVQKNYKGNVVLHDQNARRYRFVGDTNIDNLAILPLKDGKKIYGMMLIASDDKYFFDGGLDFYENCIVEFTVALKSAKLYMKMQDMARKDGLTGIYNRVYFNELFDKAAKHATSKKQFLSVALYDIDKFKNVNDTYGHLAGDQVIKMVANVGNRYAEENDGFACRYGGEEFLIVLPGKDEHDAIEILERMHEEIKNTSVKYEDMVIDVNICIGVSSYPNICNSTEKLVNRADASMYYGKKHGRGRLVLDNPSVDEVMD